MKTKIVFVCSRPRAAETFLVIAAALEKREFEFTFFSCRRELVTLFRRNGKNAERVFYPCFKKNSSPLGFFLLRPAAMIAALIRLASEKKKGVKTIIVSGPAEDSVFIRPAKMLKLKVIRLSPAEEKIDFNQNYLAKFSGRRKQADLFVSLNQSQKTALENSGITGEKISVIPVSAPSLPAVQENIFRRRAEEENKNFKKKFFTVGAAADLNGRERMEAIFRAIQICLGLIPNIQLAIIGDGRERKNLEWLAKKMGIDGASWFLGENRDPKKWFETFDLFVSAAERPDEKDRLDILRAMAAGLPVIAPGGCGLEEMIIINKTGVLAETDNSEMLARHIIKLHKNKTLRQDLGTNARKLFDEKYRVDKIAEKWEKILNQTADD